MARDEEMLVAQATQMGFEDFYRALSYWKQLADPDGADASDEERKASRDVFLETSLGGMWLGQMTLDPISGSIVAAELNRLEHDLFEADCAEAKERLGRTARIDELARTSGQRRADALVEMATRSRTAPADGIRPAPLFSVFVGYETLHGRICELENGTVLAPSALDPWMDSAYFERAIFSLGNRVDVSVRSRLFTGGTRRAIELRDRICTHPYCYEPAENCQVDHIETYAAGGPTTQDNGRLLCGFHNRLRNQQRSTRRPAPAPPAERRLRGRGATRRPHRPPPAAPRPTYRRHSKSEAPRRFGAPAAGCVLREAGFEVSGAQIETDAVRSSRRCEQHSNRVRFTSRRPCDRRRTIYYCAHDRRRPYRPDQWTNFFLLVGTGAITLTGLVFVAMSLEPQGHRRRPNASQSSHQHADRLGFGLHALRARAHGRSEPSGNRSRAVRRLRHLGSGVRQQGMRELFA